MYIPEDGLHWNPIINENIRVHNMYRNKNCGLYPSLGSFPMEGLQLKPKTNWLRRTREFLYVRMGVSYSLVTTSATYKDPAYLPTKGGRFLIA